MAGARAARAGRRCSSARRPTSPTLGHAAGTGRVELHVQPRHDRRAARRRRSPPRSTRSGSAPTACATSRCRRRSRCPARRSRPRWERRRTRRCACSWRSPTCGSGCGCPIRATCPASAGSSTLAEEGRRGSAVSGIEQVEGRPRDLIKHPRLSYLFRELRRSQPRRQPLSLHHRRRPLREPRPRRAAATRLREDLLLRRQRRQARRRAGRRDRPRPQRAGVEVKIDPTKIKLDEDGYAEDSCAVGTIKHEGVVVGRLVYAPTVLTHHVPWDVRAYKEADPVFPHHSTGDQLYTDQRFEAYRALGEYAGEKARAGDAHRRRHDGRPVAAANTRGTAGGTSAS